MNTGFYRVAASSPEIYLGDCVNNADNIIHIAESLAKKDNSYRILTAKR